MGKKKERGGVIMKPYSIKRFLELLKQNRIRRNWNGIYFDIIDYPFYDENRATPEVLNNLYNVIKGVK
jgi:hypothetical protein